MSVRDATLVYVEPLSKILRMTTISFQLPLFQTWAEFARKIYDHSYILVSQITESPEWIGAF